MDGYDDYDQHPRPIKKIGDIAPRLPQKKKVNSERAELIGWFVENINRERRGTPYKPTTGKMIGIKLAHCSVQDLYFLKSVCVDAERRNYESNQWRKSKGIPPVNNPISFEFFKRLKVK